MGDAVLSVAAADRRILVVDQKSPACSLNLHVRDLPLYDHREALRPSTRLGTPEEEEYEEEG